MIRELRLIFDCPHCGAKNVQASALDNRSTSVQLDFRGGLSLTCERCGLESRATVGAA